MYDAVPFASFVCVQLILARWRKNTGWGYSRTGWYSALRQTK